MHRIAILSAAAALASCSSEGTSDGVDPNTWTCQSLIGPVIEMSKGKTPEILEMRNAERTFGNGTTIDCQAEAEWSQGYGRAEYGAEVTESGKVILKYRQM